MNFYSLVAVIAIAFSCVNIVYMKELCPRKINNEDKFDSVKTFDKLIKTIGKKLQVHYQHTEPGRTKEDYDYIINLCGEENTPAVIQKDLKTNENKTLGMSDHSAVLIGGENWLFLQYLHGTKYHTKQHCDGKQRQAWLSIRCEDKGEKPTLKVLEEARYKSGEKHPDSPCYYLFEYNHPIACNEKSKLNAGAIFFIVLASLVVAYFLFGFMYKRFIMGAKGFEQLPNYWFWRHIGNASADGCDFVCRREEHPDTYKGMSDALDIESDDDKDDGLLPM